MSDQETSSVNFYESGGMFVNLRNIPYESTWEHQIPFLRITLDQPAWIVQILVKLTPKREESCVTADQKRGFERLELMDKLVTRHWLNLQYLAVQSIDPDPQSIGPDLQHTDPDRHNLFLVQRLLLGLLQLEYTEKKRLERWFLIHLNGTRQSQKAPNWA